MWSGNGFLPGFYSTILALGEDFIKTDNKELFLLLEAIEKSRIKCKKEQDKRDKALESKAKNPEGRR